jgi:hypothetical protein
MISHPFAPERSFLVHRVAERPRAAVVAVY